MDESKIMTESDRRKIKFVVLIITFLFIWGGVMFRNDDKKHLEECSVPVTAVVVDFEKNFDDDHHEYYKPVVSYEYGGEVYTRTCYKGNYEINDTIDIKINPDNPIQAIQKMDEKYAYVGSYCMFGTGIFFYCLFTFILSIRAKKEKDDLN